MVFTKIVMYFDENENYSKKYHDTNNEYWGNMII